MNGQQGRPYDILCVREGSVFVNVTQVIIIIKKKQALGVQRVREKCEVDKWNIIWDLL